MKHFDKEAEECILVKEYLPIKNYILKIEICSLEEFKKDVYNTYIYLRSGTNAKMSEEFKNLLTDYEIKISNTSLIMYGKNEYILDKLYNIIIERVKFDGILK